MKEYNIKMNFSVESKDSDYEEISIFAEELAEKIMDDENLLYKGDIAIVEITLEDVEHDCKYFDQDDNFNEDDY
jgi:hypothetical protein